jgi:nondiscriminating aspartyl-tRNA synthetase
LAAQIGAHVGERVRVQGWLHALRKMGEVNFLVIRDRTGLIQTVTSIADLAPIEGLQVETVLQVEGRVVEAPAAPGG